MFQLSNVTMTDDAVASTSSVANQQLVVSESELENVVVKIEEGFPACVKGEGLPTLFPLVQSMGKAGKKDRKLGNLGKIGKIEKKGKGNIWEKWENLGKLGKFGKKTKIYTNWQHR